MRIRPMTEEDVEAIARLDHAIFPDPKASIEDRELRFREELARTYALVLVAEEDRFEARLDGAGEDLRASARAKPRPGSRAPSGYLVAWLSVGEGHLLNIAVANDARRKGIAKRLLAAMLEHPKFLAVETLVLEVRASNEPARAFYEKAGFTLSRKRKGYYPDGEDALELVLVR